MPAPLFFIEHEADSGGVKWPVEGRLQAMVDGARPTRAGYIDYHLGPHGKVVFIDMIFVERPLRRHGIAIAMMDELRARHPRLRRYHVGELLPDGRRFFTYYGPWRP